MSGSRYLFVMVMTLFTLGGCATKTQAGNVAASDVSAETSPFIVYRPIGSTRGAPADCGHPYTVTILSTGRVFYQGSNCVREVGKREITIPSEIVTEWIKRLLAAGFLQLPYEAKPRLADAQFFELTLVVANRSNTIKFAHHHIPFPRDVANVITEIDKRIDPYKRWACMPASPGC